MNTSRLNVFSGAGWVLVIMAVLVLGCGRFLGSKKESSGVDYQKIAGDASTYDPKDPPPSPGAAALRMLAELEPNVKQLIGSVEAVERSAIKKTFAEAEKQSINDAPFDRGSAALSRPMHDTFADSFASSTVTRAPAADMLMFQDGQSDSPIGGTRDAGNIAELISSLAETFLLRLRETDSTSPPITTTKDGTTSTMILDVGKHADGTTKFGLTATTETTKNGVTATTALKGKIEGQRCPNAEGQLPFTVNIRLSAESGGVSITRDLTAMIRAVVGDDAHVASSSMDLSQATRQVKNGQQVYIETASSVTQNGPNHEESNFRVVRHSQDATSENARPLAQAGQEAAFNVAHRSLESVEAMWLGGSCTAIEAKSPGTVATSSSIAIPVVVRHKIDGTEVPSKLDVVLKGEKSVDPTTIAKTAGTLTYLAPAETGKAATIGLTATSRRGRATLDLNANTGSGSYQIVGGLDYWQTNSKVCDIMKPFTLTGGGFTMKVSGGLSGSYDYSGPYEAHGTGTYTISLPEGLGKPGTMTGGGEGSAKGHTNSGTEKYTLTPIEPCS